MTAKLKCAVIGAGAAGAAVAYALARRGADVHLFEQFSLFHDRGSSHGPTRLFRTAYFEHPDYVPILQRAEKLWRNLEAECGGALYDKTGVLMAGAPDSELIAGVRKAAADHGLELEALSRAQFSARFPWFSLDEKMEVLLEHDAGYVRADKTIAAFIEQAGKYGAQIHERSAVNAWNEKAGELFLDVNGERYAFDRLVIAPGAYAASLLGDIGAPVKPLRKTLFWTAAGDARFHHAKGFLPFAIQQSDGRFFYGFPAIDDDGVKVGEHTGGAAVDNPSDDPPEAREQDRRDVAAFLKQHAPGLPATPGKEQSCLYEMSPDTHFMIDKHPADERVSFAAGLSGHGFKFAPVIGEALADLATKGETMPEFGFLKLSRFSR